MSESVLGIRHDRLMPAWCPDELPFGERGEHAHVCTYEVHHRGDHGCACGQSWSSTTAPTAEAES